MAAKPEVYVSIDVEADGPIPGPNSLLSFGAVAFSEAGELLTSYTANLELLPDAAPDPQTATWWRTQPDAYQATRVKVRRPEDVMLDFAGWLVQLPGRPVFVEYPGGYDFLWLHWYLVRFAGGNPAGHTALGLRSYAMAKLGVPFAQTTKRHLPKRWLPPARHTHIALDDAFEQGLLFLAMRAEEGS